MSDINITYEEKVLGVCSIVGELLLTSGAETFRVEETVEQIGRSADIPVTCSSTLTSITIGVNNTTKAVLLKPELGGYDLQKVDQIVTISRNFENHKLSIDELVLKVNSIKESDTKYPMYLQVLGAGLVGMAPMFVFKASWMDLFLCFILGSVSYLIYNKLGKYGDIPYLGEVFSGFFVSLCAILLVKFKVGTDVYILTISSLMPLVPGVAITNSIRELIANDLIAGTARLINALFVAGAIGFGVLLAVELIG